MIASLPLFHRVAGEPVIVLGEGEAAEAKRRLVERAGGVVVDTDDRAARLAFVASEAPDAMAAELRARGVLVNVVDRPELCDFTTPSILDRSPVLIAIGTGGVSAGFAKALRLRLEAFLPQGLGRLADKLGAARGAMRARWPDAGDRRRALDDALAEGGAVGLLTEDAADRVEPWLAGAVTNTGGVVEIRLRSDDPEDLTLREARLLGSADMLAHERGIAAVVLDRARADAVRVVLEPGGEAPDAAGLVVVLRA